MPTFLVCPTNTTTIVRLVSHAAETVKRYDTVCVCVGGPEEVAEILTGPWKGRLTCVT